MESAPWLKVLGQYSLAGCCAELARRHYENASDRSVFIWN